MSWERHGVVLARNDARQRQVELVRIEPWLEHDREAAVTHGLYLVDEAIIDHDDLDESNEELRGALASVGLDPSEYAALPPEQKAEILASHSGYGGGSRSVDRLAEALPVRAEEIDFWAGKETSAKIDTYDEELRREVLEANFDTRLTAGKMPNEAALDFAFGGRPFEMSLKGADALAFAYATLIAGANGQTETGEDFAATVKALAAAPAPDELEDEMDPQVTSVLATWERRYGDPSDESRGIAVVAEGLAASMMEAIGFTWI